MNSFIRFRSLGEDFTEENLKKVIAGEKESPERNEKVPDRKEAKPEKRKFDLVVDIQEKMAQGKNGGYVQWAKKYNVKQFAESILFLQQHDIHDKETLDALVDGSSVKYHELMKTIKDAEEKMAANKVIKSHIINYAKTRETYIAYRKSGYSKKFYEAHRDEITLHKAAKEAFSKLPDGKIPKVKDLNEEFARLLSEKKAAYSEYKKIKKEMRDYQIAKQNVESFYAAQQSCYCDFCCFRTQNRVDAAKYHARGNFGSNGGWYCAENAIYYSDYYSYRNHWCGSFSPCFLQGLWVLERNMVFIVPFYFCFLQCRI